MNKTIIAFTVLLLLGLSAVASADSIATKAVAKAKAVYNHKVTRPILYAVGMIGTAALISHDKSKNPSKSGIFIQPVVLLGLPLMAGELLKGKQTTRTIVLSVYATAVFLCAYMQRSSTKRPSTMQTTINLPISQHGFEDGAVEGGDVSVPYYGSTRGNKGGGGVSGSDLDAEESSRRETCVKFKTSVNEAEAIDEKCGEFRILGYEEESSRGEKCVEFRILGYEEESSRGRKSAWFVFGGIVIVDVLFNNLLTPKWAVPADKAAEEIIDETTTEDDDESSISSISKTNIAIIVIAIALLVAALVAGSLIMKKKRDDYNN